MDLSAWLDEGSVKGAVAAGVIGMATWIIKPYWTAWRERRAAERRARRAAERAIERAQDNDDITASLLRIEIWMAALDERTKEQGRDIMDQKRRLHSHLQNEESQAIVDSAARKERQLVIDRELGDLHSGLSKVHARVDDLYHLIASRFGGLGHAVDD